MPTSASSVAPVERDRDRCQICMNDVIRGAWICTQCESWVFRKRGPAVLAKAAVVLVVPFAAWLIAYLYQGSENVRSSTQAAISRTIEQTTEILDLNQEFQVASDTLLTNCSKEAETPRSCLADYVARIIHMNGLTSQLSWKTGSLPMAADAVAIQREWQDRWWNKTAGPLKQALVAMARSERLMKCQDPDFGSSDCAAELAPIMAPFRDQTTKVMCAVSWDLRTETLDTLQLAAEHDGDTNPGGQHGGAPPGLVLRQDPQQDDGGSLRR